mgnify:CR=1 FL=1
MFETMATVCEIILLVCFGASWPFNVIKAYKARTAKGTSLPFMSLIDFGYVAGICKMIFTLIENGTLTALQCVALGFYILNLVLVTTGIFIYFRNKKLDTKNNQN